MNTHRRMQYIHVIKPDGHKSGVTRTVRNIRISELLTEVGEATVYDRQVLVERSEDGKYWRILREQVPNA